MKKNLLIFSSVCMLLSSMVYAAEPGTHLTFRHLEALQPLDPLLTSSAETRFEQHTDPTRLSAPTAALKSAIPAGTDRATAQATLQNAGAHCHPIQDNVETCQYFDVQTRDEFVDAVNWHVMLHFDHDQVTNISIDRTWFRS
ncbi:MAG TPA: hypothetical protein VF503_14000 [Sphingobium sp.]|uniref:hypothetical protein n=1 Tax=Sphingobium sp. TaxID=1912891 RepID=UPI002ED6B087